MSTIRPDSPPRRTSVRTAATVIVLVVLAVAASLAARAFVTGYYEEARTFGTAAQIPPHNGLFRLPPWAPDDATDITINVQTQGEGISLSFRSDSVRFPSECRATSHPDADPVPELDLGPVRERAGDRCGEWFVVRDGDRVHAWTAYRPS